MVPFNLSPRTSEIRSDAGYPKAHAYSPSQLYLSTETKQTKPRYIQITWSHQPTSHGFAQVSQKKSTKGIFCSWPVSSKGSLGCPPRWYSSSLGEWLISGVPFPWGWQERQGLIPQSCSFHMQVWALHGSCWPTCLARELSHLCCASSGPPHQGAVAEEDMPDRPTPESLASLAMLPIRRRIPTVQSCSGYQQAQFSSTVWTMCLPLLLLRSHLQKKQSSGSSERQKEEAKTAAGSHRMEERFHPGGAGGRFPAISGYHMACIQLARQTLHC